MPRRGGAQLKKTKLGYRTQRITLHGQRHTLRITRCRTDEGFELRRKTLADLAERMTLAKVAADIGLDALQRMAAAPQGQDKEGKERKWADKLIDGHVPRIDDTKCPTLDEIAKDYYDGTLARNPKWRGKIKPIKPTTAYQKRKAYERAVQPHVGSYPANEITVELADRCVEALPQITDASARQDLQPLKRLLDVCVIMKLIDVNPLPPGWLPTASKPKAKQWLYPAEEAQLMGCTAVPLCWRMYWGFLARNGTREVETLLMEIGKNFELDRPEGQECAAKLRRQYTKTTVDLVWPLADGCDRALRLWVELARAGCGPTARMFIDEQGRDINPERESLPELLREHLRMAGITRPELFDRDAFNNWIQVHDLRATFITVKLANGWHRDRIMLSTGHETDSEFKKYKRRAKSLQEQRCGDFAPMDVAIPELRALAEQKRQQYDTAPKPVSASNNDVKQLATDSSYYMVESVLGLQDPDMTKKSIIPQQPIPSSPVQPDTDGEKMARLEAQVQMLQQMVQGQSAQVIATMVQQLAPTLAATVSAAVMSELQRAGVAARPRPTLVQASDEPDE